MKTIIYYTDSGIYKGWQKASWKHFEPVLGWLRSGNSVTISGKKHTVDNLDLRDALVDAIHDNGNK